MRLYQNCDELPKWNFDQIQRSNGQDLRFLVYGYEYGETKVPNNAKEVWEDILQEYAEKTGNNKTLLYFEMICDINELENRAYFGTVFLKQLMTRSFTMDKDIRKEYFKQLREFNFYLNEGKPLKDELERLDKQLKVVKMKLEQKSKAAKDFEEKNFSGEGMSTMELKVKIQRLCKIQLDLKKISVTEWLLWIDEATTTKAA